jgi:ferredoxin
VRSRGGDVCRACRGKECVTGSASAYGCPTFENPSKMAVNTYCIQCTECLQACPHDNLAVNLRPWGSDLAVEGRPAADEAYLALLMLAITGFHGLTMTPAWPSLLGWLEASAGLGRIVAFSAGMLALMGLPLGIYAALIWISNTIATRNERSSVERVTYRVYFVRYAYCVLPIALFYHLAHNLEHLLMEGPKVFRLLSDPLGRGWNLFGTAGWSIPPPCDPRYALDPAGNPGRDRSPLQFVGGPEDHPQNVRRQRRSVARAVADSGRHDRLQRLQSVAAQATHGDAHFGDVISLAAQA